MINRRNPIAYLAIINKDPVGQDVLELDEWISDVETMAANPNVHPTMQASLSSKLPALRACRGDVTAGRQSAFWDNQKQKAQAAVNVLSELGI